MVNPCENLEKSEMRPSAERGQAQMKYKPYLKVSPVRLHSRNIPCVRRVAGDPSDFFRKGGGLSAAVGFLDVPRVLYAGNQHLAHHVPFQQGGGTLDGNPHAVHHGHILFRTATDQNTTFSGDILTLHAERKRLVDDRFDFSRDRVPMAPRYKE